MKKLKSVSDHFDQFSADCNEFHNYCFRKGTIRSYVDILRKGSKLQSHRFFVRGILIAVETYITLFDTPFVFRTAAELAEEAALEGLSDAERKKALSKMRKAALKAASEPPAVIVTVTKDLTEEEVKAAKKKAAADKKKAPAKVDSDPEGLLLAQNARCVPRPMLPCKLIDIHPGAVRWKKPSSSCAHCRSILQSMSACI